MKLREAIAGVIPLILFAILAAGAPAVDVPATGSSDTERRALLTRVDGRVQVHTSATPLRRARSRTYRARPLRIVRDDQVLRLAAGAHAGVVCDDDAWVELNGPGRWRPSSEACAAGDRLAPGTYRSLLPEGGRLVEIDGSWLLETVRRGSLGLFETPQILSPRNSALLAARPTIHWTEVMGAVEYQIQLTGRDLPIVFDVPSYQVCPADAAPSGQPRTCSLPWAASWPRLKSGRTYFLSIGARFQQVGNFGVSPKVRLRPLPDERAAEVRRRIAEIWDLPIGEAARGLLLAETYVEAGLLADAIPAWSEALERLGTPEIAVTLGDAYRRVGLLDAAASSYRRVVDDGHAPASARALAELGLGYLEFSRHHFSEAVVHLERSLELLCDLSLLAATEAAEKALAASRSRMRPSP